MILVTKLRGRLRRRQRGVRVELVEVGGKFCNVSKARARD